MIFFATRDDEIAVSMLFCDSQRCAASVTLTREQEGFRLKPGTTPHIPLSKAPEGEWADFDLFMRDFLSARDWRPEPRGHFFSPSLKVHRSDYPLKATV